VAINHLEIKEELLNRLRNSDIISTTVRGVTTKTDSYTATASQTDFSLTMTGIKNIREVRVNDVVQTALVDYTYSLMDTDAVNKVISFTVGLTLSDDVEIDYDYSSSGDRIYDDFAKLTVKEDKFPRIGFDIVSERTELESFNRVLYQSEILFSFVAYGIGRNETERISNDLRDFLITNRLTFQRLTYLETRARGGIKPFDGTTDSKIFKKNCDFAAPFEFEQQ
jgi:hypothetical protein